MTIENLLSEAVREAWASVPTPPPEDLRYMEWGWGESAARAFVGVAPVDVDVRSAGFFAATPLFDLPPRAAAAYLGTFLLSLLRTLEDQRSTGAYFDIVTRAHTITCLATPWFWEQVIRPHLPPKCREVLARVVAFFLSEREMLELNDEEANGMKALAAEET
jgi:hypothetical protein